MHGHEMVSKAKLGINVLVVPLRCRAAELRIDPLVAAKFVFFLLSCHSAANSPECPKRLEPNSFRRGV